MSNDVEIRGTLLVDPVRCAVLFRSEDGIEAWLPRDQIAIVHDVEGVVVTMPERLAKAKGIY
jgi:hypothetical protein